MDEYYRAPSWRGPDDQTRFRSASSRSGRLRLIKGMFWRGSMRTLCKTGSVFVTLSFLDVGFVHAALLIDSEGRRRSGEAIALDPGFHVDDFGRNATSRTLASRSA